MMQNDFINEQEVRKAVSILKPDGQLFEVRILCGKKTLSGYFTDAETLLKAFEKVNLRDATVYFTLNFINEACYSRTQHNRFVASASTTSDGDINGYQWMLIDLDPNRSAGVSSTEEELQAAAELGGKVYQYMQSLGFEEPVKAKSGNGYHLLYRIGLKNTPENRELVQRCLEVLSSLFSNEQVKIDTVNYNPSRICKLYGTLAQKGASTENRPHRMSRIFSDATNIKINDIAYLHKLAAEIPQNPKPEKQTKYHYEEFSLVDFLHEHGIGYKELNSAGRDNSTIYALNECPFDSNHKDGDAKIFAYPDGAISFRCHHNSCYGKKWQDVRLMFEPDAYERTDFDRKYEEGWKQHNRNKENVLKYEPMQTEDVGNAFRTAREIYEDEEPEHEFILSGITEIDKLMHGFEKQCISVISGLRASGKSTLIGNLILQAVNNEHTVVVYSGELSNKKYLNWLTRQAAGKNNVEVSTIYQNGVGVPNDVQQKINNWFGDKFWLYDNKFGNNFQKIADSLVKIIEKTKADICIIDNLMALDLSNLDRSDKYEAQTKFVWKLKEIAMLTNTHIVFVAHPKKSTGFLRLEEISGSGNIANIVDNAFMVHRVNLDFAKRYKDTFGFAPKIDDRATNVIEIAKAREEGIMDYFIPLYFEPETKRLKNSETEFIQYGWEEHHSTKTLFCDVYDNDELPF